MAHIPFNQGADRLPASRRPIPEWLDEESIGEFRRIWKDEFGEEISDGYARIRAREILELYLLISRNPKSKPNDQESKLG